MLDSQFMALPFAQTLLPEAVQLDIRAIGQGLGLFRRENSLDRLVGRAILNVCEGHTLLFSNGSDEA